MGSNRTFRGLIAAAFAVTAFAARSTGQCTYDWRQAQGAPIISGVVSATETWDSDGDGPLRPCLVVAGDFKAVGGFAAENIVCWNGDEWSTLADGLDGQVNALIVYQGDLIATGAFYQSGVLILGHIARWDGSGWQPLGGGLNGSGRALAIYDGELVVAGDFQTAGGESVHNIAKWDGTGWSTFGAGFNMRVGSLCVHNGDLFASGSFTYSGSTPVNYAARWNGSTWESIGPSLGGGGGPMISLGGDLIVSAFGVYRWTGTGWQPFSSQPGGYVYSLVEYDGELYAASNPGLGLQRPNIYRWDGSAWHPIHNADAIQFPSLIFSLSVYDDHLIMGGSRQLHHWDHTEWRPVARGFDAIVRALFVHDGHLLAGGDFQWGGGERLGGLARWNGDVWARLDSQVNAFTSVSAFGSIEDDLIVGGYFSEINGTQANNIARWNGSAWTAMGQGIDGDTAALATIDGELFAGGNFLAAGGQPASNVARWDGTTWHALGSGTSAPVWALIEFDGDLIAGGDFDWAGGGPTGPVARWHNNSWQALGEPMVGQVFALAEYQGKLYVGGRIAPDPNSLFFAACWNGAEWQFLAQQFQSAGHLAAFAVLNNELLAGGDFPLPEVPYQTCITRLNGDYLEPFGPGSRGSVVSFAIFQGELFVGGELNNPGNLSAEFLSRWGPVACDCNTNGIDDADEIAGNDCNTNGILDECDQCGDFDGDADVDGGDISLFLLAFGASSGSSSFLACADFDTDGMITFVDYQHWVACFREFIQTPFAPIPVPADLGDMNADGVLDARDISRFVETVQNPGLSSLREYVVADMDGNGAPETADIESFVNHLLSYTH